MPKSIPIMPEKVFARGRVHFSDIDINVYQKSIQEELATYSRDNLLSIWQDMCAIREFESILNEIKVKGTYKGVSYNHLGPLIFRPARRRRRLGWRFHWRRRITFTVRTGVMARFWRRRFLRSGK